MNFLALTLEEQLHSECQRYLLPEAMDGDYFDYASDQVKTRFIPLSSESVTRMPWLGMCHVMKRYREVKNF